MQRLVTLNKEMLQGHFTKIITTSCDNWLYWTINTFTFISNTNYTKNVYHSSMLKVMHFLLRYGIPS